MVENEHNDFGRNIWKYPGFMYWCIKNYASVEPQLWCCCLLFTASFPSWLYVVFSLCVQGHVANFHAAKISLKRGHYFQLHFRIFLAVFWMFVLVLASVESFKELHTFSLYTTQLGRLTSVLLLICVKCMCVWELFHCLRMLGWSD